MLNPLEAETREPNHPIQILTARWCRYNKRILIYGAGEHTAGLFQWTNLLQANIVGIADKSPLLQGRRLWGFEVLSPDRIPECSPEVILISSKAFQDEIYDSLRHLESRGIETVRLYRPVPLQLCDEDARFDELYRQIADRTMVSKPGCYTLYQLARQVRTLKRDVAEVGVYRGGTAKLLSKIAASWGGKAHLFDTFTGMPETHPERDLLVPGWLGDTSEDEARHFLRDHSNACIYPGLFPATAAPLRDWQFSLVHVDVDIYQSVWDCCEFFYPRVMSGGILVYDDYGWWTCPGAKLAVDEYFADKPEQPVYLPTGQCVVIRLSSA